MFESRKKLLKQIKQLEEENERLYSAYSYQLNKTVKILKKVEGLEIKVKELEEMLNSDPNHQIHIHYDGGTYGRKT